MYKGKSNGWFHGLEEGIKPVPTSKGVTQGDTLGSWIYCVGTMKFLKGLSSLLQTSDILRCFIDDTNVCADFDFIFFKIKKNQNNKTSYHNSQILETKTNLMNMNIINKVLVNH